MKIALLGYGKMGKAIEELATERGHEIVSIQDKDSTQGDISNADVAINFSIPSAAVNNLKLAFDNDVAVVSGTTGWLEQLNEIHDYCKLKKSGFLYASNFSIGVNLFFKLNELTAQLMKGQEKNYTAHLEETHHIHKLDAPSGTAITLAEGIAAQNDHYKKWSMDPKTNELKISAYREGEVPGTHSITYSSEVDEIRIEHKAHSRQGFALGAVIAAEWLKGKEGIFSMKDVLNL
ncbi:MAG: 4-hydroxy-tetrahydrodipicolinate reductase [Flavobacteriaceae bacterium]|nr:4-hydroxy-tetrahydrodipicolinate reductase [Flavobacteriaceae bacterium]